MLESIKVSESLHWPEAEMSTKLVLNSASRAVSPSQVFLERHPSGALGDLLRSDVLRSDALRSDVLRNDLLRSDVLRSDVLRNDLLRSDVLLAPEDQDKKNHKQSPYKRAKRSVKSAAVFTKGQRPGVGVASQRTPDREGGGVGPSHARPLLSGKNLNLPKAGGNLWASPAPAHLRRTGAATAARTKLPSLHRAAASDGDRKQCVLAAVRPSNVAKEKAKFFKSDFSYDPQFEYSGPVSAAVRARYGDASDRFLTQAVHIMELALQRYGTYEKFEQVTGGNLLSKSRILHNVKKYMEKEGCSKEIVIQVTDGLLSRASMTVVNSRPTLTINVSTAREHWLEGMLRHEIGTHYFRCINNCQQSWSSGAGRRRLNLKPLNPTEEGLASIHSVLFRKDPTLWRAALLYYTVFQARHMSFSQLFDDLGRFVQDPNTRWDYCVRAKRGQTNTALPGCFSKDQVYLDGILKILRYRDKIDFPLLMALGKVSFEDMQRLKPLAQMEHVRIPHFMQDQARYAEQLTKIMAVNQLTDEDLRTLI